MLTSNESSVARHSKFLGRREFIACLSGLGFSSAILSETLWAKVEKSEDKKITKEMIAEAEHLIGLEFTDEERKLMIDGLKRNLRDYKQIREVSLDNSVVPAVQFNPVVSPIQAGVKQKTFKISTSKRKRVPSFYN